MPKRTDIASILIIGAGPIVIGQACEFDYSGAQACKALKAEGYRVILVNSNPATIMTDPGLADATYIEPITPEIVERIIAREKPDALLPTMGGQTALNIAMQLAQSGALARHNVELIGARADVIELFIKGAPDFKSEIVFKAAHDSLVLAKQCQRFDSSSLEDARRGGLRGNNTRGHRAFDLVIIGRLIASRNDTPHTLIPE